MDDRLLKLIKESPTFRVPKQERLPGTYTDRKCGWCKKSKYRKSTEGCYGSFVHCICLTPGCGHEWDIVEK